MNARTRKATGTLTGDGSTKDFDVIHNLGADTVITVKDSSANIVEVDVSHFASMGGSGDKFSFAVAPGVGETYYATIVG